MYDPLLLASDYSSKLVRLLQDIFVMLVANRIPIDVQVE